MTYNPLTPDTLGLEWFPATRQTVTLDSAAKALAFVARSTATETIDALVVPFEMTGPPSGFGKLWVDVYDLSDMDEGSVTEVKYIPNQTLESESNAIRRDWIVGGHTTLETVLDHYDDNYDKTSEYIVNVDNSARRRARLAYNSATFPSTARPLYVKFEVSCLAPVWAPTAPYFSLHWFSGSTDYGEMGRVFPPKDNKFRTYVLGPFYVNPKTQEPWTQDDIENLDSATLDNIGLVLSYSLAVTRVTMVVGYVTDKRVAMGGTTAQAVPPVGVQTNLPFTLKTRLLVDNFAKTSGRNYLFVVRRLDHPLPLLGVSAFAATIQSIDSGLANPQDEGHVYEVALVSPGGQVSTSELTTKAVGYWLATTGAAQSVDEQPYRRLLASPVDSGSTVTQRISGASAQTYGVVRALVGVSPSAPPNAALTVKVKRVSDNVQLGGDASLTVAQLADAGISIEKSTIDGVTWYDVRVAMASTATLAAVQYYLEFSSTSTVPWYLGTLDASADHSYTGNRTVGGATDYVVVDGVSNALGDVAATLSATNVGSGDTGGVPAAVTGLGVTPLTATMPTNGSSRCSVSPFGFARITWTATAIGALFVRYEIDRSDDNGTTWDRIAEISDEATNAFDDYEGPHDGSPSKYRIRVVSTAAASVWSTQADTITQPVPDGVVFVSNAAAEINCGYVEASPSKVYEFLSSSEEVEMRMHFRDYQTVFKPTEERGVRWSVPLIVWGTHEPDAPADPSDGAGVQAFARLRLVGRQGAPYVAVFTPDGERFFASVRVPSGGRREPAAIYIVEVTITQVAGSPSTVED